MTDFLLIRHGETAWNRELRFQGQLDVPLNDMGVLQAQRLKTRMTQALAEWQALGRTPTRLISSDLLRAQQTAQPLAEALGSPCLLEAGLREQCFGLFEGLRSPDIQALYPQAWQRWLTFDADEAVDGAESTRVFHARVIDALQTLAHQYAGEHVVVVTHGVAPCAHPVTQWPPCVRHSQCRVKPSGLA
jgi:probable phosphoglycerate mutase